MAVSAVINTWNEEKNIGRCLTSLKSWIDEIIVVDMESTDLTCEIAKKFGARVFNHPHTGFVEPARNYAIEKATTDWIFIIDADEQVTGFLADKITDLVNKDHNKTFFRIPRKNIIFGKWIEHGRWWPDLQIRLFKKGSISWVSKIHSIPVTLGEGIDFEIKEENAIIHYNYDTVSQFLTRMDRYTTIQAKDFCDENYEFRPKDLLRKPVNEFISRYLAGEGYRDGIQGLAVCVLQAISEFVLYLKFWENSKDKNININPRELERQYQQSVEEINYWIKEQKIHDEKSNLKKFVKRVIP